MKVAVITGAGSGMGSACTAGVAQPAATDGCSSVAPAASSSSPRCPRPRASRLTSASVNE